ncbi:MAG: hypothetical protein ACR2QQ_05305 [Gammaproteobacteria bacterium]
MRKASGSKDVDETMVLYMGVGTALGLSVGSALGVAFGNIAIGMPLGLAFGLGLGAAVGIERKMRRWMATGFGIAVLGVALFAYVDVLLGRFTVFVGFLTIVLAIILNIAASQQAKRS